MPYLTQLAAVARRTGYPVTEVSGWKTRGHGVQPEVQGVVCHHTAGPASGDYPSLGVVRDGRSDLPGPLSHFGLARTGRIYVIAAGRCWHNAPSTSPYHDNSSSIGIEAENTGTGQAWPAAQLDSYRRLCAEICREFNLPASRVVAHREVNKQKIDPRGIDMPKFRAAVANLLKATPSTQEDDMDPNTIVKVPAYWADKARSKFSHPTYSAAFLWAGTLNEVRAYGSRIEAKLAAQQVTIAELTKAVAALAANSASVDPDALVARIQDAINRVTVHLDVESEPTQ